MAQQSTLQQRCAGIALLVLDVDGVLTDGRITYGTGELEVKSFHVRDGSALKLWSRAGKHCGLITGRSSPLVAIRAAELDIEWVVQGARDKLLAYQGMLEKAGIVPEAVCYVGDDLPDLAPLQQCGLAVAVGDACPEVRACAHYITRTLGGCGAVREVIELILRCQGSWQNLVAR
jgi:YrbI family 3-deoxy-D-manno-octulosonate 8-phosphate phosphatase